MPRYRKPETLALYIALISTLTVLTAFMTDLALSRQRNLNTGEERVRQFSIMMAEHAARSFEAADLMLREIASDLSLIHRAWPGWNRDQGYDYLAQRRSWAMPQVRDLIIFDRFGTQRFGLAPFPPSPANVRDRPYFTALENGDNVALFGPYVGRNSGRYTYGLAHRIVDAEGNFLGLVLASMEPLGLQDFCWPNRLSHDFESVLINAGGQIVASCRPVDLGPQSPLLGLPAAEALFAGRLRGQLPQTGTLRANGLVVSLAPVPGFADLRVLTAIPETALLVGWHSRRLQLTALGGLIALVLLVGGLVVRRQVRDLATMSEQLAASHKYLEERIHTAVRELAEQKDAAERANRAKSRFLAAASHDLRQPLHALSLFAADLRHQAHSGSTQELPRLAKQISATSSMLGELLDSLLHISRLDIAEIAPEIRDFPLQSLFDHLDDTFRRSAVERNLALHFRPTPHWLTSDPALVERILANLLTNALRFTPSGGRILVAARRRGKDARIEVRDCGIGIAPEHQEGIFAEFYQVDNPMREPSKGLGLGLSIVDRLARALNIRISLLSRLGAGTTVALHIPLHRPSMGELAPLPPTAGSVYLCGDSAELNACRAWLSGWNYTVSAAS
ncbi:MAG: ATP-binding protein, partial [Betaproteobacteria bacterium]|nr:ATP-binding protein [Betaproteobacteria bacterium]